MEVKADENAQHDVYRKNLLKEVLDEDRRISSLAMFNLGFSYLSGNSPQDHLRAYMWFTISAARYKARAFYALTSREKLILRMTPVQIESAEQMAHQWMMEHWGHAPIDMADADFKELQRRLTAGDKRALDEIIRRAESGDQAAQIELGEMYWSGIAVKPDPEKAFYWWTKAADGGNVEMMTKLGILYSDGHPGHGIAPDPPKGEFWLLKAGKKGYSSAAHLLTMLYREGKGAIPADTAKYRYWYERWAEAAARKGDFRIASRLAGFYTGSIDTEHNVKWPEDPAKAASLYEWAADSGDVHAQTQLGIIYLAGRGVEKDEQLAFQWFLKAADSEAPVVTAWAHLVVMYEQGIGTGKDDAEAQKFLDRILDSKHYTAGSLHMIGQLYHQGNIVPRDDTRAAHYYHMSSVRGEPEAQFHLGQLFWNGSGVAHSPINAYAWWIIARDNIFDSNLYPYPLIKAALDNADKSMARSDKSAADRKVKQLIKEYESMGIVKGKRMGSKLKKVFHILDQGEINSKTESGQN